MTCLEDQLCIFFDTDGENCSERIVLVSINTRKTIFAPLCEAHSDEMWRLSWR